MSKTYSLYPLSNSNDISSRYASFQNVLEHLEEDHEANRETDR